MGFFQNIPENRKNPQREFFGPPLVSTPEIWSVYPTVCFLSWKLSSRLGRLGEVGGGSGQVGWEAVSLAASLALTGQSLSEPRFAHPACERSQRVSSCDQDDCVDPIAEPGHQEIPARDVFLPALPPLALKIWRMGKKGRVGWSVIGSILRFAYLLYPGRGRAPPPQGSPLGAQRPVLRVGPGSACPREGMK